MITRRCSQRSFRLRPSQETNRIFMYCLAFALEKTGVLLHAACVMSNHHHLVVTDPRGVLPDFLRELHRLTAKAMNASQGHWENLWAAEPCNVVRLVTDADVADKIAYVVANPVAAGLVTQPEAWPGFLSWGEKTLRVTRPLAYFSEEGTCPHELRLVVEAPPTRDGMQATRHVWMERVARAISEKIRTAHRAARKAGREFLGPEAALAESLVRTARSKEDRRGVVPTFAAKVTAVRKGLQHIEQRFRARYREALGWWRRGRRDVVFPHGTWGMRVFHAAMVGEPLSS
jgi:putative transposase